jgi:hypothetical protein
MARPEDRRWVGFGVLVLAGVVLVGCGMPGTPGADGFPAAPSLVASDGGGDSGLAKGRVTAPVVTLAPAPEIPEPVRVTASPPDTSAYQSAQVSTHAVVIPGGWAYPRDMAVLSSSSGSDGDLVEVTTTMALEETVSFYETAFAADGMVVTTWWTENGAIVLGDGGYYRTTVWLTAAPYRGGPTTVAILLES